jgi:hypothetical protein
MLCLNGACFAIDGETSMAPISSPCHQANLQNEKALELYRKGNLNGAIDAVHSAPCTWVDYQLLFDSYVGLYMQNPDPKLDQEARSDVDAYMARHDTHHFADPGPLYVALGDFQAAVDWYKSLDALFLEQPHGASAYDKTGYKEEHIARALKVLQSRQWKSSQKFELLHDLLLALGPSPTP